MWCNCVFWRKYEIKEAITFVYFMSIWLLQYSEVETNLLSWTILVETALFCIELFYVHLRMMELCIQEKVNEKHKQELQALQVNNIGVLPILCSGVQMYCRGERRVLFKRGVPWYNCDCKRKWKNEGSRWIHKFGLHKTSTLQIWRLNDLRPFLVLS